MHNCLVHEFIGCSSDNEVAAESFGRQGCQDGMCMFQSHSQTVLVLECGCVIAVILCKYESFVCVDVALSFISLLQYFALVGLVGVAGRGRVLLMLKGRRMSCQNWRGGSSLPTFLSML